MKTYILIAFLLTMGITKAFSQCTPIPFTGNELTNPDTVQGIAPAAETQAYTQIIHMRIPADTIYNGAVIPIDSVGITDINGLPTGFTWLTNEDNNHWPGDTFGCIIFQGTPDIGDAGSYSIAIDVSIYALGTSMPYTMNYNFEILDNSFVGFTISKNDKFILNQNQPNPFDNSTLISYNMPTNANVVFTVYNIIGNVVYHNNYSSSIGKNTIKFEKSDLSEGIYIYELLYGNQVFRKRMVIK